MKPTLETILVAPRIQANAPIFCKAVAQELAKKFLRQAKNMEGDEKAAPRLAHMAHELAGNPDFRRCAIDTLHVVLLSPRLPFGAHTPLAIEIVRLVGEPAPMKRRYHDALEHAARALHPHPYAPIAAMRYIRMAALMDDPEAHLLNATMNAPAGSYLEQATAEALVERLSALPDSEEACIRLLKASADSAPERALHDCAYAAYAKLRTAARPAAQPTLFSRGWFAALRNPQADT